jgi:TRAF3-interacting protein 1
MEEALDQAVKATMGSMGKLISKPPMTDKLLRKPPFRFLHDIFSEVRMRIWS